MNNLANPEVSPVRARLSSRISSPDVSFRTRMQEIAATLDDVVSMGPGDPDLPTPQHIVDAAKQALDDGMTHYTVPAGDIRLRRAVTEMIRRDRGIEYNPDSEVIITVGAEEAIYLSISTLIEQGDEVLLPAHRFTTYDWAVEMSGGKVIPYPTIVDGKFKLDVNAISARITPRTKILVVVSPDNPTGGVASLDELKALAALAEERDLLIISDEIYSKFLFDGNVHHSIIALDGLKQRCLMIDGLSKCYAMTGWRVGFLAGPADYMRSIIEVKHALSICTPALSQVAALAALEGPQDCITDMLTTYERRRHKLLAALDEMGLSYITPAGAFYVYVDISSTGMASPDFSLQLLADTGIMISPGVVFAGEEGKRYIRMSLLVPDDRMDVALQKMSTAVRIYKAEVPQVPE